MSIRDAVLLARTLRRALQRYADDPVPEILSGHLPDGTPARDPHAAFVALPLVGFPQAAGEVSGLAIIVPRTASPAQRQAIDRAIASWEEHARRDGEGIPSLPLYHRGFGRLLIERIDHHRPARTLQPATWCGPARRWTSVTPVVFDRYPGKLQSSDAGAAERAREKAVEIIAGSCERIGLPAPDDVDFSSEGSMPGVPRSSDFPIYPGIKSRQQRFFLHATIAFPRPVSGPVLLGAGRFEGLGLMRPLAEQEGE